MKILNSPLKFFTIFVATSLLATFTPINTAEASCIYNHTSNNIEVQFSSSRPNMFIPTHKLKKHQHKCWTNKHGYYRVAIKFPPMHVYDPDWGTHHTLYPPDKICTSRKIGRHSWVKVHWKKGKHPGYICGYEDHNYR